MTVLAAKGGVEPQSETVWRQADEYKVPRMVYVNKMDTMGADFYRCVQMLHDRLHANGVPIQLPVGQEDTFKGIIDLIDMQADIYYDDMGNDVRVEPIPEDMQEKAQEYHDKLIEAVAETDEELMMKYLEGEELTKEEIKAALRKATISNEIVPVVCGSSYKNRGVQKLLDAIVDYMPAPTDVAAIKGTNPETGEEVPDGVNGEFCSRGYNTMKGYYNKPDETDMILRRHPDGRIWVHTGDIGYLDEDGFVFLDSRIKRLIIRHDGFKVFPSMIENVISRHPAVHQCSVVGCADKDHVQGRLPFVYVVLKPDTTAKKKQVVRELERMCAEELPEYVQPVAYKFIPEMPMTPVGKIDYRQLEADISPRDY